MNSSAVCRINTKRISAKAACVFLGRTSTSRIGTGLSLGRQYLDSRRADERFDYISEQSFREAISNLQKRGKMTIIIIAHRASTISDAEHLVVLKDGVVEEAGPVAEFKKKPGWIAEMMASERRQED